jgi:hypothetical protein
VTKLQAANVRCFVGIIFVGILAYADDLALLAPSESAIIRMLHIYEEYALEYRITFHGNKSNCIVYNSKTNSFSIGSARPSFFVYNQHIDFVDSWVT